MARKKVEFDAQKEIKKICDWIKNYFVKNGPGCPAVIGISGGKDSTVAAMLLVKALGPERVVGVMMPEGNQSDIKDSIFICEQLGINAVTVNIEKVTSALYNALEHGGTTSTLPMIRTNTPARIRMSVLYAIAAEWHGRVVNTCNYSEDYVGYSTKYGDLAGDFSILKNYVVREVKAIGYELCKEFPEIGTCYIDKTPADGMCGKSDEDNLGFSYETLDAYIRDKITPDYDTYLNIETRHKRNIHKDCIRLPAPSGPDMEVWSF